MDVAAFCRQSKVVVVVGKGGVGKTTVTAALALAGARAGLDVSVLALDDSGGLPGLFGVQAPLGYKETVLFESGGGPNDVQGSRETKGRVRGRLLTPDQALIEYLDAHGLGRISRRLVQMGALDVISTAVPGMKELLVLAKLKHLEQADDADLFLLDAPATGHAYTFLTSSHGLMNAARGGPLRAQAEQVVELLSDPARCQVLLVTIPEETPVNEAIETAYRLEEEIGIALGPIVVNTCFPNLGHLNADDAVQAMADATYVLGEHEAERLGEAARFRFARQALQHAQIERLDVELPLPQIRLPDLLCAEVGPVELAELARAAQMSIGELT